MSYKECDIYIYIVGESACLDCGGDDDEYMFMWCGNEENERELKPAFS